MNKHYRANGRVNKDSFVYIDEESGEVIDALSGTYHSHEWVTGVALNDAGHGEDVEVMIQGTTSFSVPNDAPPYWVK